jgi:hypothetical protein
LKKLTENVWLQNEKNPLFESIEQVAFEKNQQRPAVEFVHVVNPFDAPSRIEEQQLAFASIKRARAVALSSEYQINKISLIAAAFPEDRDFAERHFDHVVALHKSSLDMRPFGVPRKLPLLFDVVMAAGTNAGISSYVLWTNADICLAAGFYDAIATLLALGFDAITVNRRDIPPIGGDKELLPLLEALVGVKHPGFDCFIFPLRWIDDFIKTEALIGMPGVARSLLYNLVAQAETMLLLNAVHLTFHVGSDASWNAPQFADYKKFNFAQARLIYPALPEERKKRLHDFCRAYGERQEMSGVIPD